MDESIATVDESGKITGVSLGKTKIEITDEDNGYSTYIIVNVTSEDLTIPQIKAGTDFTVTLKANGTVWTFGKNTNGQLGNDSTLNSNEPVQVLTNDLEALENIVDIAAGENSAVAVNSLGEVYTWGLNLGQVEEQIEQETEEGIETITQIVDYTENQLTATKVEGLTNIVQVESYKNNFYAVDLSGNLYIWGKGYISPTKIETEVEVADVSGDILLGKDGRVYYLADPMTSIDYLNNIYEISSGTNHYLFAKLDGSVYSLGTGTVGQLGNGKYVAYTLPTLVKTENGYLKNVSSISAGNNTSMAVTFDGKAYVWGDNTNKKLGITDAKIAYATEVSKVQDKDGNEINLSDMEVVEAGVNNSYLADINGYVYSVGLNTQGQLGTEDNVNRTIFTRIGKLDITTKPEQLKVAVNTTKDISIMLSNSFNLKTDIMSADNFGIVNTNEKEITIQEIDGVDNSKIYNVDNFKPNYRITGNKIGRVNIVVTLENMQKNVWVNVVNSEESEVPAKVVNGDRFTVSLRADGTVWTWGVNNYGQLGLGDTVIRNKPEQIELGEQIVDISTGKNHTLLLGVSGNVYSFGYNAQGQLGTKNNTTFKVPTNIGLSNITKVVAIENSSYAITSEGKVYAWGSVYGKSPVLLGMDENVNVIDIGYTYYLADDGIVRKIKDHEEIKLSLNEYELGQEPEIVEDDKIVQISEGTDHILLLGESGRVYSYGNNIYGQLGDKIGNQSDSERTGNITTVVRLENGEILENVVEVSAGDKYSVVVTKDGQVYTFGINGNQQLGYSNELETDGIQESGYAILKDDITNVERVSAGYTHTSVYREDGNVYTWGNGQDGQLGNSDYSNYYSAQLVGKNIVESNTNEILIEKDDTFDIDSWVDYFNLFEDKETTIKYEVLDQSIALIDPVSGEVIGLSAGRTTVIAKELETGNIGVINLRILEKGTKPESMTILVEPQVVTQGSHTVMLKVDGTVWCYGIGTYGELGNNSTNNSDEPVQAIFPAGTIITKIAAGENHCLALDSDGNVWTWGRNNYYQQGNTQDASILKPTKISSLSNIKDIECGIYTSFAIGKDGEVYSWGLNANGEGGIGSYTNKITVNRAVNLVDAIDIKAGRNHTMILKSTGEVYVTGSNLYGELGLEDGTRKVKQFTKVNGLDKVVSIAAGDSNNTVVRMDGSVYAWGSNIYSELGVGSSSLHVDTIAKVAGLSDIRYVDGGSGYTLALDSKNVVYEIGLNTNGQLGNNSSINVGTYTRLDSISDVMQVSAGNAYTMMLKTDGTVWACGDYTHGDTEIKSKTRSIVPVQVGNDETGLEKTEITVAVGKTKEIADNCAYEFNLIKLEDNYADSLDFTSLNEGIATVNEKGIVTGEKVGTTRVKAVSTVDGKVYSVLVKVVQEEGQVAPRVESGEDFAAVLKANGEIWTFGYNADGRLGLGNNITKDVPEKTNIISTYKDIKAGKDFIIALRENGTVWSAGNNKYGQLGNGTTTSNNKLTQIQGLSNIVQIAAGEDFAIAMDNLGIIYAWGNNNGQLGTIGNNALIPTEIAVGSNRILDIAAGKNQSAFVTAKGTVVGMGSLLNGTVPQMNNAIKAEVTKDAIIILTSDMEVFEYKNDQLTQINIDTKVIDISAKNGDIMYQTVNEETYVSGQNSYGELGVDNKNTVANPVKVKVHGTDTYGIGVGYTNTYIIENTGNVYAAGNNEYGSLGNGTRKETKEHILVGERIFEVDPETDTMYVDDKETIEIDGNPFNVFNNKTISNDEYEWTSDDEDIVSVDNGILTANSIGTAKITIKDKITGEELTITRIVIERDADRILKVSVDNTLATISSDSTETDIIYEVKVITNENTGKLEIKTNNPTDRIRLKDVDSEDEWQVGTYTKIINLEDKETTFTIIVSVQNNEGNYVEKVYEYTLIVEKISDDIQLEKITVTSTNKENVTTEIQATPVSATRYEVVVDEFTDISKVTATTRSKESFVSIDGKEYELHMQEKNIVTENSSTKEVTIVVKSEAGTEAEYTLVIHKKSEAMNLSSLKVNGEEATKVSETVYAATVEEDCNLAEIKATVSNTLASISIANQDYQVATSTRTVGINSNVTEVSIKVMLDDDIKEYTLYIYRADKNDIEEDLQLDMLIVNGAIVAPEKDGVTYIAYLPSSETEATIRAIAKENTTQVQIADGELKARDNEKTVEIPEDENEFIVTLTNTEGKTKEYTVIIRKAEKDVSLDRIYVSKDDVDTQAVLQDDGTYLVKVPSSYENVDVTAIAKYIKAKVQVTEEGTFAVKQNTENVVLEENITEVKIKVQSEDGTREQEYILKIQKKSNNADLLKVEVDGKIVELGTDGKYHYQMEQAANSVNVKATADDVNAYVRIDNTTYTLHEVTKQINITAKQIEVPIKVRSEDGQVKDYVLIIEGLPDDTTIAKVVVNGKEATYIDGKNRYEIRLDANSYDIEVTLNDLLAKMVLSNDEQNVSATGKGEISITKTDAETIVKVLVTAQNGIDTEEYTIVILEKSRNTNLDILKVNGVIVYPESDGINYYATIKHDDAQINIEATAEDTYAITTINGDENDSYIATFTDNVIDDEILYYYTITVEAEDGTKATYNLTVKQLDGNTDIIDVLVGKTDTELEKATLEDGIYYYRINEADEAYVKVVLDSDKSTVSINGGTANPELVEIPNERNVVIITVKAEDGTTKDYTLIIEKKSSDTSILSITGDNVISTEIGEEEANVYIDEDVTTEDLTITLTSQYGSLKLADAQNYTLHQITTTVNFTGYNSDGGIVLTLSIMAEDGTEKQYTINVYKQADLGLSVVVNEETLVYDEVNGRYEAIVDNGNKPVIVITANNSKQPVKLLNSTGTSTLQSGVGSITTTQTLSTTDLTTKYIIQVSSHNGENYGVNEYELWIRQKSKETGITYVMVDSYGTMVSTDGLTYSSTVAGKDNYPVEIKLKDPNAMVRIEDLDRNVVVSDQTGILTGEVFIPDGETVEFILVVTSENAIDSENGDIKEYSLIIQRVSSDLNLKEITVTDYDTDGNTIITKNVVIYDQETKTYSILVNRNLQTTDVNITAVSEFTDIVLDSTSNGKGTASITKSLSGLGINRVTIKLTAADGTQEIRYLDIIQLSDDIGIQTVKVDGKVIEANEAGNYETTVTDEFDLSEVIVTLTLDTSEVSINGQTGELGESTVEVSKGNNRVLKIPIKVTAEDGITSYTYTLTLHIISHDTSVRKVIVDDETAEYVEDKYIAYISKYAEEAYVEILAGVPYSTVTHTMEDETEVTGLETINFTVDTHDLDEQTFTTKFTVIAEDKTEKEYTIELIRKSDDDTIKNVFVNDNEVKPNIDHPLYDDDTYYVAVTGNTAKVKVVANHEFATVEFNKNKGLGSLEQIITLSTKNKITEIPVKITSQEGTVYETIIYIERLSANNNLLSVEVNYKEAEEIEENIFAAYIYDSMTSSHVKITAEDENATVIRTNEDGIPYLDEEGLEVKDQGYLTMDVPTLEDSTVIYFKIVSESGEESVVYTLYIDKMSTDTSLVEIYVDDKLILPNEEGKYVANVLDTNTNPLVKAITNHNKAQVRIALGGNYMHIAEERVSLSNEKQTIIPITVISQAGTREVTNLYINKISTSVALSTVTLDNKEADYYTEETHTYRFLVDSENTDFRLFVVAESDYTTLEFNDQEYEASFIEIVSMEKEAEGITLTVIAKSESGLKQEYTIEIARRSNSIELEYLKVDGITRQPDVENGDTYTVYISKTATSAEIEIKTMYSYATVKIADNPTVRQIDKKKVDCDLAYNEIKVPIVVTAVDGTTIKTYTVKLVRSYTVLEGKVITENANDIHKATVSLYLTSDTRDIDDEADPRQAIEQVETNNDGTFRIEVDEGVSYDLVVTKLGYLTHTITNIKAKQGQQIDLGDISILAGDIVKTGEIEIDDLVALNYNIGEVIEDEDESEKLIYDLNEDGIVDEEDLAILRKNYGKKDQIVEWVNPDEEQDEELEEISVFNLVYKPIEEYILPMNDDYVITSNYGYRINPITGENKLHAGIDIVGTWHTEILSVADGIVTYAGVQSGYGNCVEIKHTVNGETVYSFYAHLSEIRVKVGEEVSQGTVIGLEGGAQSDPNHGSSTGHHLHFEIRSASGSGHSMNPTEYIEF